MAKASTSCFRLTLIALTALVLTESAYPDAIFRLGNNITQFPPPVSNITNVSSNKPEGEPLEGYVSAFGAPSPTNANAIVVHVTSNDGFLCATSGGVFTQPTGVGSSNACNGAFIPGSGFLKSVTMTPCLSLTINGAPCWGFRNFQFGVSKGGPTGNTDPNISIDATLCELVGGKCASQTIERMAASNIPGNGFVGVFGEGDELVTSVTINSLNGFEKLESMRINTSAGFLVEIPEKPPEPTEPGEPGEPPLPPIPEPSSVLLLGSGVLGLAQVLRRKLS